MSVRDLDEAEVLEPEPGTTPLWANVRIDALFEADVDVPTVVAAVASWFRPRSPAPPSIEWHEIEDDDWSNTWRRFAAPLDFCGRLSIVPRDWTGPESGVVLRLDPGLAFGTGAHATTALCLEWLAGRDLSGLEVVDYGCGSGVLGIAALLLGASRVIAVDYDPQARLATQENGAYNGFDAQAGRLAVLAPDDIEPVGHDVVIANILADPLVTLAPVLTELVRPGGRVVLSGLRVEQLAGVTGAYPEIRFAPPAVRDGWVAVEGTRRGA